jgi:hypothetical protein
MKGLQDTTIRGKSILQENFVRGIIWTMPVRTSFTL